jgi:hypothetical protein
MMMMITIIIIINILYYADGEGRGVYRVSVGKPLGKRPLLSTPESPQLGRLRRG